MSRPVATGRVDSAACVSVLKLEREQVSDIMRHCVSIARTLTFVVVRYHVDNAVTCRNTSLRFAKVRQNVAYNEQAGGSSPSAPTRCQRAR